MISDYFRSFDLSTYPCPIISDSELPTYYMISDFEDESPLAGAFRKKRNYDIDIFCSFQIRVVQIKVDQPHLHHRNQPREENWKRPLKILL